MLRDYNFEESHIKKMMSGNTVVQFAQMYCTEPSRRGRSKANPEGSLSQPYKDILDQQWTPKEFRDLCVQFVTSSVDKYGGLINGNKVNNIEEAICYRDEMLRLLESRHNDFRNEYHKNGYGSYHHLLDDDKDICLPDAFSNSIVKPLMRAKLQLRVGSPEYIKHEDCIGFLSKIHDIQREIAQIAGDLTELRLLETNKSDADTILFPTFSHKAGDDFLCYDRKTASFSGKDVKTSRFPKHFKNPYKRLSDKSLLDAPMPTRADAMSRPDKALQRLYAGQGHERFSSEPRLLLVRTPAGSDPSSITSIQAQFKKFYTFEFEHKCGGKTVQSFTVKGAQIIFF